jgi:hypothetical protein
MKQIKTRIAGFNHHKGAPDALMRMRAQTRLLLVPEPDNPHDKNAIRIVTTGGLMLGFVPKVDNVGIGKRIGDKDVLVRCFKTSDTFNSIAIQYETGDPLA